MQRLKGISWKMDKLILSFTVVAPLVIMMLCGAALKKVNILNDNAIKSINKMLFRFLLPILIFYNVYMSDLSDLVHIKTAITGAGVLAVCFITAIILVPLFEKDNRKRGVIIQGICRSNFVIFGIPLSVSICGESVLGRVAIAVAIVIPVINFFSVIALEIFRSSKPNIIKILKGIVTNPLIISSVLGLLTMVNPIRFPGFIETTMRDLSGITTPLALVMLGASVNLKAVKENKIQLALTLMGKLILVPAFGILVAKLMHFDKTNLSVFISMFASPTAISSYIMAEQMDGDGELAAQIVAYGTVICIFTVFLWVLFVAV